MINHERGVFPQSPQLRNLKGTVELHTHVLSYKDQNNIKPVDVRIVHEGSGMAGLKDPEDNKEWAGMFNHVLKMTRFTLQIACEMQGKGANLDRQLIMNACLNSHTKRRQWDEAVLYPGVNPGRINPQKITNEKLGVEYLQSKKSPDDVVQLVAALAHGLDAETQARNSLEFRIAVYADHRTSQTIEPLNKRMADFFIAGYAKYLPPEQQKVLQERLSGIISKAKNESITKKQAVAIVTEEITCEKMNRGISIDEFVQFIIYDAATEKQLEDMGLDPATWTENTVTAPRWERYLRRLYVQDAEEEIFTKVRDAKETLRWDYLDRKKKQKEYPFWNEFNQNSWWGKAVVEIYRSRKGKPQHAKHEKPEGIDRAILFFDKLVNNHWDVDRNTHT